MSKKSTFTKLNYFKKKLIDILVSQENKEEQNIEKAVRANIGEVRTRKDGFKYKKINNGEWKRVYESETRGARLSIAAIKRKIDYAKDEEELMNIIMTNKQRFVDSMGFMLPIVKELDEYIDTKRTKNEKPKEKELEKQDKETKQEDLELLSNVLKDNASALINHPQIGEISVETGKTGKHGYGLKHIIEQRFKKDGKTEDEITALLTLILDAARDGEIVRNNEVIQNGKDIGTYYLEKNGIIAFVSKSKHGTDTKFIITGFDDSNKKEEAADAIKTVIADNSYAQEFIIVKQQVGAVIASLGKGNTNTENVNINDEIGKSLFDEAQHPRGNGGRFTAKLAADSGNNGGSSHINTKKLQNLINQQRTNLADVEYLDLESIEDLLKKNSGVKDLFLTSEMNVEIRKSRFINRLNYEFCKLVEREKRREAYREAYLDKLGRGYIAYLKKYYPELV